MVHCGELRVFDMRCSGLAFTFEEFERILLLSESLDHHVSVDDLLLMFGGN
jgi:hypothetical protein